VPVMALGPPAEVLLCLELGAEDFLLRPYQPEMLARRVQEERLEEARRERLVGQADRVREPQGSAFLFAVRQALNAAAHRLAHPRSAPAAR